jgi:Peptidase family S41
VDYLDASGKGREARFEWRVLTGETPSPADPFMRNVAAAIDPGARATEASTASVGVHWSLFSADAGWPPFSADTAAGSGRARAVETSFGLFGQLFVPTFVTSTPLEFLRQLQSAVEKLPAEGLIVDVRGNTGGSLPAAVGLAQLLSTDPVPLVLSQLRATPESRAMPHLRRGVWR